MADAEVRAISTHGRVRLHDGGARLGVTIYNTEYVDPVEKWRELAARILEEATPEASDERALAREMASEMVRARDLLGTFIAEHPDPGANALASCACMERLLQKAKAAGLLPDVPMEAAEAEVWYPIETAPKHWESEDTFTSDGRTITLRIGRSIMVRGTCGGEELTVLAYWAQQEGFPNGATPHWWDLEGEGPIDWPIIEWRELTAAERQSLATEGWA